MRTSLAKKKKKKGKKKVYICMRGPTGCCAHHSRSPSNYWCYVTHYIPTFFLGLKFVNHDLTQYCLYIYFMEAHNNIFL